MVAYDKDSYEGVGELVMLILENEKGWVISSCCSYHMCPRKEYFKTLKLEQGRIVLLGDNKACKVHVIGTVRIIKFKDREFILHNMRYFLEL